MKLSIVILLATVIVGHAQEFIAGSTLLRGLSGWWSLEESSGTRYDRSPNANHLSPTNTPGMSLGIVEKCSTFNRANSRYLDCPSSTSLAMGDVDFTVCGWVKLLDNSNGYNYCIASKFNATAGKAEYSLYFQKTSQRFAFAVYRPTDSAKIAVASTFGLPAINTWYFVCGWHDAASDTVNISVNDGTTDSTATTGALQASSNADFSVGMWGNGNFMDGSIDEVGVWKRLLTAAERTRLYNNGRGNKYPFLATPWRNGTVIASSANTTSHRPWQDSAILNTGTNSYVFYMDSNYTNKVVSYSPTSDTATAATVIGIGVSNDPDHNYTSASMDPNGYVYAFYGAHTTPQYYRRTVNPYDITSWTTTNTVDTAGSYPKTFVDASTNIYMVFRSGAGGGHRTGSMLKSSDLGTNWLKTDLIDTLNDNYWVYFGNVGIGNESPQKSIHLIWTIRYSQGTNTPSEFTNIYYACSFDGGTNWKKSDGTTYTLPISIGSSEVVYAGANVLPNQVALTSANIPMALFSRSDDGSWWTNNVYLVSKLSGGSWGLSTVSTNFAWEGQIALDASDNPCVFGPQATGGVYEVMMYKSYDGASSWRKYPVTRNSFSDNQYVVIKRGYAPNSSFELSWSSSSLVFYRTITAP